MPMREKNLEMLAKKITPGMNERQLTRLLGSPDSSKVFGNPTVHHYMSSEWQLLVRVDSDTDKVINVELVPLSQKMREAFEYRKRLEAIADGTGEELPEPLKEGGTVEDEEYEVYTALCRTGVFRFDIPGTTFDDLTRDETVHLEMFYRDGGPSRRLGTLHDAYVQYPGLLADFEAKNARRARLEKRFNVSNGYQLLSERDPEDTSRYLILSRVGFSSDRKTALVYIEYVASCGLYVLFRSQEEEPTGEKWTMVSESLVWES